MGRTKKPAAPIAAPTLYKVLRADGTAPHVTHQYHWSLPVAVGDGSFTPGAWHEEPANEASICVKGLHVTPCPDRWWCEDSVTYVVEAEGIVGDPWTEDKVIAARVRLLRPVTDEEASRASDQWSADLHVRERKSEQKARLDKARASALAAKRRNDAARAAGIESPALTAFRLLVELTPTESWRDVNSCRFDALAYATEYLQFDPGDVQAIYSEFRGSYWFGQGSGACERLYERAIKKGNVSACVAWEKFFDRKPWIGDTSEGKRERLAVGTQIRWEGVWCVITSMNDEKFVACTYKKGTGYERKIDRRFTVTREAFKQAFGTKKAKAA